MPGPQKPGTFRPRQGSNTNSQSKAPAAKSTKVPIKKKDDEDGTEAGNGGNALMQRKIIVKPVGQLQLTEEGSNTNSQSKAPAAKSTKVPIKKKDDEDGTEAGNGGNALMQRKIIVKPIGQLQLTEEELNEDITRMLTTKNPHAPQNLVRFSYKDRCYIPITVEHLAVDFVLEGNLLHIDSDEAQRQIARKKLLEGKPAEASIAETGEKPDTPQADGTEDSGDAEEGTGEERPGSVDVRPGKTERKVINQFNFITRPTQTLNGPPKDRACQTEPPKRATFSDTANQWIIYDAYEEELQKRKEKQKCLFLKKEEDKGKKKMTPVENPLDYLSKLAKAAKIMERVVVQNIYGDIAMDFKYYEDPSDEFKEEGTLLPLWTFEYDEVKHLTVTSLCWNPKYSDLFGVGFGSYNFEKQANGMLLFYTMKNHTFPEYRFTSKSGVMCLDFHKQLSYLVAVGFFDGTVGVYNLINKGPQPIFQSDARTGKHRGPVWQVKWDKDDMYNNHNFISVSCDGRVVSWTLVKVLHELRFRDILKISVKLPIPYGQEYSPFPGTCLARGRSFDFHPKIDHLYLVGSDMGKIYKCSKWYSSHFLESYDAHDVPVDTVKWNPFHPDVFISCSHDWMVKIWDHNIKEPAFTFDFGKPVDDVAWSPYSSTVFAALTIDGKAHVYDLNVNKYKAICQQKVMPKKIQPSHIEFNPVHPMILVGDYRGNVYSFKLSPNLRRKPKDKKGQELPSSPELEVAKMEHLLRYHKKIHLTVKPKN